MEDSKADNSADKLEVVQMFRIDARMGIDLEGVIVMCRVFKQTVEWVEHFMRKKEEEFAVRMISILFRHE